MKIYQCPACKNVQFETECIDSDCNSESDLIHIANTFDCEIAKEQAKDIHKKNVYALALAHVCDYDDRIIHKYIEIAERALTQ